MALTITRVFGPVTIGDRWMTVNTVGFDSSYPAGGEALTAADLGLSGDANDPELHVQVCPSAGYVFEYDHTNGKVIAYEQTDPAATGGANVPLVEVGDTSDLSAVDSVRVTAYGKNR